MDGSGSWLWDRICIWNAPKHISWIHKEWSQYDKKNYETLDQLCSHWVGWLHNSLVTSNAFSILVLFCCFCPNILDNQGLMELPGHILLLNRSMWLWTTTIQKKRWWSNPKSASFGTAFCRKYNISQVRRTQLKQMFNPHPSSREIPIQIWCRRYFVRLSCGGVLPYLASGGELQYRSAPPMFKQFRRSGKEE